MAFKFNEKKMKTAMDLYMKNDHWKSVFENAPSENCKEYFRFSFYNSQYDEPSGEEFFTVRDKIYDSLGIDDWKYLKKNFPGSPFTKKCAEKIAELSGK